MPELGVSKPPISRRIVVLPQPDGPEKRDIAVALQSEVHAANGVDRAVGFVQAARFEKRGLRLTIRCQEATRSFILSSP